MINMNEISLELRFSAVLGIIALVLSFLVGVIAGNSAGQVVLKTLSFTVVFLAIGYLAAFVIRKYVPEMYDYLSSPPQISLDKSAGDAKAMPGPISVTASEGDEEESLADEGIEEAMAVKKPGKPDEEELSGGFVPFNQSSFDAYSTEKTEKGDLGKHLFEERKIKYEPKIMAEAIRTMMSRDKE